MKNDGSICCSNWVEHAASENEWWLHGLKGKWRYWEGCSLFFAFITYSYRNKRLFSRRRKRIRRWWTCVRRNFFIQQNEIFIKCRAHNDQLEGKVSWWKVISKSESKDAHEALKLTSVSGVCWGTLWVASRFGIYCYWILNLSLLLLNW